MTVVCPLQKQQQQQQQQQLPNAQITNQLLNLYQVRAVTEQDVA